MLSQHDLPAVLVLFCSVATPSQPATPHHTTDKMIVVERDKAQGAERAQHTPVCEHREAT